MSRKKREELEARFHDFFKACAATVFCADDFAADQEINMAEHPANETINGSNDVGFYFILDAEDRVLYVGSATVAFGKRYWPHDKKVKKGDMKQDKAWQDAKKFVLRALKNGQDERKLRYLRALESYLIAALDMPDLNQKV
jgi:predicted GIY-YIG superfamily endonuclease